jgi:NAD(P)-dependent dehydrogenase (short-subunit alcohol dehydrogenase family)
VASPPAGDADCTLVFADARLGPALVAPLENQGRLVVVEPGSTFARLSAGRYQVRLSEAEDYDRVVGSLSDEGVRIGRVVHLTGFGPTDPAGSGNAERDRSLHSVLFLARSVSNAATESAVRFIVAGSRAQHVDARDDVEPERSEVLGLVQTIVQEMPSIDARHVDVAEGDVSASALAVLDELRAMGQEREVAYRNGIRFVSRFERLGLPASAERELPFKTGGMYLLTGGLGGVGVEIGKFLLEKYRARLLVLGRTPVVRGAAAPAADEVDRLQSCDMLTAAAAGGAAFRYEAADVTDAARVREVVQAACADWGCGLDGVIHMAGIFRDRLLLEETPDSLEDTRLPKIDGCASVARLLERDDQVLIAFSSATGYFGRFSGGAYAAASRGLDALVRNVGRRGVKAYSLAWSEWEDMGMMRGWVTTQSRSRGYTSMSKAQGLNSLITALRQDSPVVLIGIDADAAPIRPYVAGECRGLARLVAFVQAPDDASVDLSNMAVADRLGRRLPSCDVERVAAIPTRPTGEVDREALVSGTVKSARQKAAPTTDLERTIARVWEQVLNVSEVDARTTFFDAGGSSLLMAKVYGKLKTVLPHSMSMTEMFRYPTVAALAAHLSGGDSTFANQIAGDRERGRERRTRVLQTRRGRENDDAQSPRGR